MRPEPTCPRCAGPLRAPGLWSSAWQCERHGAVAPFTVLPRVSAESVEHILLLGGVPLWLPWPVRSGWVVSGMGYAGDDRTGARATVLACSGPSPLGGAADLLLVAEDPGVGLGARYAGLAGPDPGDGFDTGPPDAKLEAAGHPTALWCLRGAESCAAFVGEAKGLWLWALVWPAAAGVLLYDTTALADLRERGSDSDIAYGSMTPRLSTPPAAA